MRLRRRPLERTQPARSPLLAVSSRRKAQPPGPIGTKRSPLGRRARARATARRTRRTRRSCRGGAAPSRWTSPRPTPRGAPRPTTVSRPGRTSRGAAQDTCARTRFSSSASWRPSRTLMSAPRGVLDEAEAVAPLDGRVPAPAPEFGARDEGRFRQTGGVVLVQVKATPRPIYTFPLGRAYASDGLAATSPATGT